MRLDPEFRYGEAVRRMNQIDANARLDGVQATLVVDVRWRIVGWSTAAAALFGCRARDVVGRPCREVLSCRDASGAPLCPGRCPLRRALASSTRTEALGGGEIIARGADGGALRLATEVALGPEEASGHVLILVRPRADDREANPIPSVFEGRPRSLIERALDGALDEALTATGAEVAEVFLAEDAGAALALAGVRGACASAFRQLMRFRRGEGFPGLVLERERPLLAPDATHDPRYLRTAVQKAGFRYYLCVPIPGPHAPFGSLHIASRDDAQAVLPQWLPLRGAAQRLSSTLQTLGFGAQSSGSPYAVAGAPLELRCLGRFSASHDGVAVPMERFARRRALTVLKILLVHEGKVVSREQLADLLWPEGPPRDAATLLKVAVHYLRRGLAADVPTARPLSYVVTQGDGYAFNLAAPHRLDVREFRTLAEQGVRRERAGWRSEALTAYQAAIDVYAGDFLEDEPYADWALERRHELRQIYLGVLRHAARLHASSGDGEAAIRCHRRALALDPCLEDVHRELMHVLWSCGRRSEALRQFALCRSALHAELDVAPVRETVNLYRAILAAP